MPIEMPETTIDVTAPNTITLQSPNTEWTLEVSPGFLFCGLLRRPAWWFRLWQRVFLGWKWSVR